MNGFTVQTTTAPPELLPSDDQHDVNPAVSTVTDQELKVPKRLNESDSIFPRGPSADPSLLNLLLKWPHPFTIWNQSATPYSWCHKEIGRSDHKSGILFVKVNKWASSTGMGV